MGTYKDCLFKDSRKRRIWCIFNWMSYFGEICSRAGSTPKLPEWAASGSALGWLFLLGCICGMSPLSPVGACLLWDEVGQKRNGRTRSRAPENRGVKVQNQHRPPAMSLEMEKSKLSTIVSAPKCYNLWHVPGHSCTPWHQGKSLWMTPWGRPLLPALISKCIKVSEDKEESFIYRGHLTLTVL